MSLPVEKIIFLSICEFGLKTNKDGSPKGATPNSLQAALFAITAAEMGLFASILAMSFLPNSNLALCLAFKVAFTSPFIRTIVPSCEANTFTISPDVLPARGM